MNNMTAVVLASGLSRRMGHNKLLMDIGGRPMITYVLELLKSLDFRDVLVVTGYPEIIRIAEAFDYRAVINDAPEIGQSHSVVLGVTASPDSDGWFFFSGDMPGLQAGTIHRMMDIAGENRGKIILPVYENHPGQPVCFPSCFYDELIGLTGDEGGRQIIRRHPADVIHLDIKDAGQGMDIDTPEDLENFSSVRRSRCNE